MARPLIWALIAVTACSEERTRPGTAPCTSWREDVEPAFQAGCLGCHGESDPAGGVDLSTYEGAIAVATRLVAVVGPEASPPHDAFTGLQPTLRTWVEECDLSYFQSDLHPGGIMNPADPQFHGALLEGLGWDFAACANCHGDDFSGGSAQSSCLSCHTEGPTACTTCHGVPPSSGAHALHGTTCQECHTTPAAWDDPGHLDGAPADVTFGPFAALDVHPESREGPPAWDAASGACRNVYCHGDPFGDTAARNTEPLWAGGSSQAECGTCHGLPPSDHAAGACQTCHGTFDDALHVDGAVRIGDDSGTCSACHGDTASAAPTDGGHRSHVFAFQLRGPVACSECHAVPTEVRSPGHIDTPLPAEVTLAGWDDASHTCTGAACHGTYAPDWTSIGTGEAACATCHGIPPSSSPHVGTMTLTDCATCHPSSVDAFGNPIVAGGVSTHIDGDVDF